MKKAIAAIVSAVMAVSFGAGMLACSGESGRDGANGIDGINGVDGESAYELYVKAHPDYSGSEADWLDDMAAGKLSDRHEYSVVSFGRNFSGTLTAGTAASDGSALSLDSAVIKLNNDIIMPIAEDAEWEINIGGVLANGGASAELLASLDKAVTGRVYFGVFADSNIAYLGVNEGGYYFNYCWDVPGVQIKSAHEYTIRYKDGEYTLSVDGGAFKSFTKLNQNQSGAVTVADGKLASSELNDKIRACNGQDYFAWTSIGADTHKVSCKLDYIDITTSSIYSYKVMSHHPLYGKTIYHLGSSISYGHASGGVSFADQIATLTGSKCVKQTVSGTTLVSSNDNSYVQRFGNFSFKDDPAFLVLQLSTNDFALNKPIGAVTGAGIDTENVCGAIEYIVSQTKRRSPDTQVVIYTCPIKSGWGSRSSYAGFVNNQLKQLQRTLDVIVLDLFNAETIDTMSWMSDDIHPNGYEYANRFTPAMINAMVAAL